MYIAKRGRNETDKYFHSLGLLNFLLHVLLSFYVFGFYTCVYACSHMYAHTCMCRLTSTCVDVCAWEDQRMMSRNFLNHLLPEIFEAISQSDPELLTATTSLASVLALVIPCLHFLHIGIIGWPQCPPSRHRCSWNLNSGQVLTSAVYMAKTLTAETSS